MLAASELDLRVQPLLHSPHLLAGGTVCTRPGRLLGLGLCGGEAGDAAAIDYGRSTACCSPLTLPPSLRPLLEDVPLAVEPQPQPEQQQQQQQREPRRHLTEEDTRVAEDTVRRVHLSQADWDTTITIFDRLAVHIQHVHDRAAVVAMLPRIHSALARRGATFLPHVVAATAIYLVMHKRTRVHSLEAFAAASRVPKPTPVHPALPLEEITTAAQCETLHLLSCVEAVAYTITPLTGTVYSSA